jgi:threonine dehydrogenase-like Zn-dependent dehydrogenase
MSEQGGRVVVGSGPCGGCLFCRLGKQALCEGTDVEEVLRPDALEMRFFMSGEKLREVGAFAKASHEYGAELSDESVGEKLVAKVLSLCLEQRRDAAFAEVERRSEEGLREFEEAYGGLEVLEGNN